MSAPLTMMKRKGRIGVAAFCRAIGMLSIPLLLVNMLLLAHPRSSLASSLSVAVLVSFIAWTVAICLLVLDMLMSRWRATQSDYNRFDVFISHDWGSDLGQTNHRRAKRLNDLLKHARHNGIIPADDALYAHLGGSNGLRTWFDEDRLRGDLIAQMSSGIDRSACVIVCITTDYIKKVYGRGTKGFDDNCKFEFEYAQRRLGVNKLIPVVIDADCRNTMVWEGTVGMVLGSQIYVDMSGALDTADGTNTPNQAEAAAMGQLMQRIRDVAHGGGGGPREQHRALTPHEERVTTTGGGAPSGSSGVRRMWPRVIRARSSSGVSAESRLFAGQDHAEAPPSDGVLLSMPQANDLPPSASGPQRAAFDESGTLAA